MRKLCLFVVLMSMLFSQLQAQIKATTEGGETVILKEDGTWSYDAPLLNKDLASRPKTGDCSDWVSDEVDKMTGERNVGSREALVVSDDGGRTGFGIYLFKVPVKGRKGKNLLVLTIQVVGAGSCVEEGNEVIVLFTDGSRITLKNDGKFNCDSQSTIYFGGLFGNMKELGLMKMKPIETIRVWTRDKHLDKDFTEENQDQFIKTLNCLLN